MFSKGFLKNPVNDFIWSLPIENCGDRELDWTIKNLLANFQKLYGCTTNLLQVQYFNLNNNNHSYIDLATLCTNLVEYFFLKINTIWEICFQIYAKLCKPKKAVKSRHQDLEVEFDSYRRSTGRKIALDWYEPINAVRNRIAHGGFSIKSFLSDDFLLFQVYDRNLDRQILDDFGFIVHDKPLVYVDLYTTFYTTKTHQYIQDFLAFVINRMGGSSSTENDLDILAREQKESGECLYYGYEEIFISTAKQLGTRTPERSTRNL